MYPIIKRYRFLALFTVIMAIVAIFLTPLPAKAGFQRSWQTSVGGDYLVVGPNNLPRVLNCGNGGVEAFTEVGSTAWGVAASTPPKDLGCGNMGSWSPLKPTDTISSSGNTAVSVDTNSSYGSDTIELWDESGDVLWQHTVMDECNNLADIGASPIISDGIVVFTYKSCLNWGHYNLRGLDEDDSTIIYDTSLGAVDTMASLAWAQDGVLLFSYGEWRYISSLGVEDPSRAVNVGYENKFATDADGGVVFVKHDDTDPNICYLVFRKPGEQDTQKSIDCAIQIGDAKTMPNGDLVAITDYGYGATSGVVTIFHKSNIPDTTIEIEVPSSEDIDFYGLYGVYVDISGNILVSYAYSEKIGELYGSWYHRAAFSIHAENGDQFYEWSSDIYGEKSVSTPVVNSLTLANGGVYFNDLSNNRLISIQIPSVSMSYADSVRWGISSNTQLGASFVAMGDSYSSGEGSNNYDIDDSRCHRSSDAYAFYIAEELELDEPFMAACSGAVTDDINPSDPNAIGQIDMIGLTTDYVTLTLGGNDVGFTTVLKGCADYLDNNGYFCSSNPDVSVPLSERMTALAGLRDPQLAPLKVPDTDKDIHPIAQVLTEIANMAPNAKIYVAGYPKLFGQQSTFSYDYEEDAPGGYSCIVNSAPLYDGEVRIGLNDAIWINTQTEALNTIISNAVEDVNLLGKDVYYVPPTNFDTHGLCDSSTAWINDIDFVSGSLTPKSESFHPNPTGMAFGYGNAFVDVMD